MEILLQQKEDALRAAGIALGDRVRDVVVPGTDTLLRIYTSAAIAGSAQGGVHAVHGPLFDAWMRLGAEAGPLGDPASDEIVADGDPQLRYACFRPLAPGADSQPDGGAIIRWDGHTRVLRGAIGAAWCDAFADRGLLPLSDSQPCEDGAGTCAHVVERDGGAFGSLYHHPATGVAYVRGGIRDRWLQLGGERGLLGYPVETEAASRTGRARLQHFRDPVSGARTGTIAEHPGPRAFAAHGPIHARWMELGADAALGDPFTDVFPCPDGVGTFIHFRDADGSESSIYATPATGAHLVRGAIRDLWGELGWEKSDLGYPVADEAQADDGVRIARFQNGSIAWSAVEGARRVE